MSTTGSNCKQHLKDKNNPRFCSTSAKFYFDFVFSVDPLILQQHNYLVIWPFLQLSHGMESLFIKKK